MATDTQANDKTFTELVKGILNDAQELFKQQITLTKREIQDDFRRTKEASLYMGAGAAVAAVGGLLLCFMLVHLLQWAFPELPLWGAYGIVGLALTVLGMGMIYAGKKLFDSFNPLPDQSAAALRENVQWITSPK